MSITYEQWLRDRIVRPGMCCGPDVTDDRAWWQHLPPFNPYRDLERLADEAVRQHAAGTHPSQQAEAEAG